MPGMHNLFWSEGHVVRLNFIAVLGIYSKGYYYLGHIESICHTCLIDAVPLQGLPSIGRKDVSFLPIHTPESKKPCMHTALSIVVYVSC